ncbi:putative tubulin tyrosine ligase [Leishmania major strain Friedlin]|uniref:Putative tubulin tyrosine ligase n=1 Tax=Leishmania major TaxID=5664 RepID=Q4QEY2_LEIMA|nr:putative tubulin tyrosine ligase [Leishmania major strain Friedlin]CAG9572072.1 tubulin_tyrosine_ligase_-_putative [Leishmania major strain Friedlin]CAJ03498.1 putative tubulin tyrosine ligase [Leishmania major strain Friedlin]|eukprot:XP_001682116.1 putative tubulin tyrosine ligase [Leishmania major strain Friedlin]
MEPATGCTSGGKDKGVKSSAHNKTPAAAPLNALVNAVAGAAAASETSPHTTAAALRKKKLTVRKVPAAALTRKTKERSRERSLSTPAPTPPLPRSPRSAKRKNGKSAERPVGGEAQLLPSAAAQAPKPEVDADSVEKPPQQEPEKRTNVVGTGENDLQQQRALPPEDSDDGSCDADGFDNGASARVVVPVTSLAGKRHTKLIIVPGPANGSGAAAPASSGLGNGHRTRAAASISMGSSGGSHHHGDCTLRYRTDLDKQVIHFMFERYQHEQTHPTTSAAASSPLSTTNAGAAEGTSARVDEAPHTSRGTGAAAATSASQVRARRINVEEICVTANNEGEDKNIGLGDWHFFWMHVRRVRHTVCSSSFRWQEQQIINHFPDHAELTRKDLMYKNIRRYLREHQADNYARLTLHTATDWVSASAHAADAEGAAGPSAFAFAGGERRPPLSVKSFCFADSVPLTYNIPNDMSMFKEKFQRRRGTQWIVKPTSRSQGKGIFIIDDVRSLQRWMSEKKESENMASFLATSPSNRASWVAPSVLQQQRAAVPSSIESAPGAASGGNGCSLASPTSPHFNATSAVTSQTAVGAGGSGGGSLGSYIISRYISNPLLIGGKKFDLRLYVLVTSYKPLVAYLHEDGFARFCATRYAGSSLSQEDLGSHLTNVALQKGDEHYNTLHGGKWSFQNLFLYVQKSYGPYTAEGMVKNIQFLIYHSLKAVEPVMFNDKHSYELYGYDILIDDHINPHLIEVNASPSMSTTTLSDRLLKEQVLTDTMKIVFPPGYPASNKGMPYWEYRLRTDLTTRQKTGFKLLQF